MHQTKSLTWSLTASIKAEEFALAAGSWSNVLPARASRPGFVQPPLKRLGEADVPGILGQWRRHQEDLGGILDSQSSLKRKFQVQGKTLTHKLRWKEIEGDTNIDLLSLHAHI